MTASGTVGRVVFKRCTECDVEIPHGYLHRGDELLPVAIPSVSSGMYLIKELIEDGERASLDLATAKILEQEMRSSGLPEVLGQDLGGESAAEETIDMELAEFRVAELLNDVMSSGDDDEVSSNVPFRN